MHKEELTGLYHLFVTEYQNHCPMTYGSWTFQNSIRHATSASVNGPWVAKEMVLDGAGNPLLMKAPDGTYLLYFTGVPRPFSNKPPARNCNGANRTEWGPTLYCAHPANCGTGLHLAHSQSLDGPWEVELNIVDKSIAGSTNPGGMVLPGGGVLLFYKGSGRYNFSSEVCPGKACRSIGVVSSPAWNAFPYKRFIDTGDSLDGGKMIGGGNVLEDPSNGYIDNVCGAVHMIFHQAIPSAPGGGTATSGCNHTRIPATGNGTGIPASPKGCGYGASPKGCDNGSTWIYATPYWNGLGWKNGTRTAVAYEYDVDFNDGSVTNCIRREEPKLLLEGGLPVALLTQCTLAPDGRTQGPYPASHPAGEVQWTTRLIVQPIKSGSAPTPVPPPTPPTPPPPVPTPPILPTPPAPPPTRPTPPLPPHPTPMPPQPPTTFQPINTDKFCCDQVLCRNGQSQFLFKGGGLSAKACAAVCTADPLCNFITIAAEKANDSNYCFVCQYCNTTSAFNKKGGSYSVVTYERTRLHLLA
jgi:hypothetical protein